MASCLVPEFPAVMVAVEHLKELDNELSEAGVASACPHLAEITAAITQLEAERRTTHEDLEVETILNSELRHRMQSLGAHIRKKLMAAIEAARAANDKVIKQLREEISTFCLMKDEALKRHLANINQNKTMYPERAQLMSEHEELVATLNDNISRKYSLQLQLEQTLEQTEELKCCIATAKQDKVTLWQNMLLEREAQAVKKDNLYKEEEEAEEENRQQKQAIIKRRREVDDRRKKKEAAAAHLNELFIQKARLESNIGKLSVSRKQYEEQLEAEVQKRRELEEQEKMLKKKSDELEVDFSCTVQRLQDDIAEVENKIKESQAMRQRLQETLAKAQGIYKRRQQEEKEMRADHDHASQELEQSKVKLEKRIAALVKYTQDTREIEKMLTELQWNALICKRTFERNKEELCNNLDREKTNIFQLEEERIQLHCLLIEGKIAQEEHEAKMSDDISNARRRFEELMQGKVALQQQQPKIEDSEELEYRIAQAEIQYKEKESMLHQAIKAHTAEAQSILEGIEEKQKAAEEKDEMLKEVEGKYNEEKNRYMGLRALSNELNSKRTLLKLSIEDLKGNTSALLQPRVQRKAQLKDLQERHITTLNEQVSELTVIEASIYNNSVKLEQFCVENSRLHLAVTQMTEEANNARQNSERYLQETQQFIQDTEALVKSLKESWIEDARITQESQTSDRVILESFSFFVERLTSRREQIGNVRKLLHQNMVEFSRWLRDTMM